jgi:hypothetical protein
MGNTLDLGPGRLNLVRAPLGKGFKQLVDFSIATTDYEWEAIVRSAVTGATVATIDVTVVSAANGQVNIELTTGEAENVPAGTWEWVLSWKPPGLQMVPAISGVLEVE